MSNEITIPNDIISLGLDTKSALTKMRNGYSRLIKNFDLNNSGWIEKRTGYQIRSGIIPIKIFDIIYENGLSEISFDPSLSLSNVSESPISLSTPILDKSIYVDEFKWEVIANKTLDISNPSFTTKISNTSYINYLVRDETNGDINHYQVGGTIDLSWSNGTGTDAEFDFSDYLNGSVAGTSLTVVPVELKEATADAISYAPANLNMPFPSDINDKVWDHAINDGTYMAINAVDTVGPDYSWTYLLPESTNGVGAGGAVSITWNSVEERVEATIPGSATGFNSNLVTVAAYSKNTEANIFLMDAVSVGDNGDIHLKFIPAYSSLSIQADIEAFIRDIIIVARQVPVSNHAIRVANGTQTYEFDNIDNEFNIYDVYTRDAGTGTYTEVLPTSISYNRSTRTVTVTLDTDITVETVLLLWAESDTPLNKIQIAGDLTDYSRGHVWGIPHEDNYVITAPYGGRVAGLINRSDVGEQELISSLGGNFYSDTKGTNNALLADNPFYEDGNNEKINTSWKSEDYYIPSPEVNMNLVSDYDSSFQAYYGTRFLQGTEDLVNAKGRGFSVIRAGENVVDSEGFIDIPISNIVYDSQVKRLSISFDPTEYSFERDWTDPASYYNDYFTTNDLISLKETGNEFLDGDHSVVDWDATNQILYIEIPDMPANFNLANVELVMLACFTDSFLCTENKLEVGTVVDNTVFGITNELSVIKSESDFVVIKNIQTTKILPAGINLAGSTKTTTLNLPTVYNLVYGDMLSISGYDKKFKVININAKNIDANGNPEEVEVELDSELIVTDPLVARMNIFKIGRWNPILGSITYPEANDYPFQYLDNYAYSAQETVEMQVIKDVVLVDNYANTTFKYDGDKLYRAGLPNWRPIYSVYEDQDANQTISVQKVYGGYIEFETLTANNSPADNSDEIIVRSYRKQLEGGVSWDSYVGREFGFRSEGTDVSVRAVLDSVEYNDFETLKDYVELRFKDLTQDDLVELGVLNAGDPAGTYQFGTSRSVGNYIGVPQTYNYMARLYSTDAQGNKVISKNCGYDDYQIEQVFDSALAIQLKIPDEYLRQRENGRWEIELVRTKADGPPVYYFITSVKLDGLTSDRFMIYDATADGSLLEGDLDSLAGFAASGDTLATTIKEPARALYSTTADNRYIQANIQSEEILQLTLIPEYTDPTFSYREGAAPVDFVYDSRIAESELAIEGQNYSSEDGEEYSISYSVTPTVYEQTTRVVLDAVNSSTEETGWTDTPDAEGDYIRIDLTTLEAGKVPVAITLHSPFDSIQSGADIEVGPLQGTHAVVGYDSQYCYIDNPLTYALTQFSNIADMMGYVHYINPSSTGAVSNHKYEVNCPAYPFIINPVAGEYEGQVFDYKSKLRVDSTGQSRGSQMDDVANYVYDMQEMLDRLGRITSPRFNVGSVPAERNPTGSSTAFSDAGYPVFPLYTNRDTTDKRFIEFYPKTSDEQGFSFRWKNGKQCILEFNGLIYNNPSLGDAVDFEKKVFPSRVLLSSENYPEIMNNPYIENTTDNSGVIGSLSAIDINADDGQEITGITSFLTESIFSAANLDSVGLVFKTNSVYALDVRTKQVSKIETFGLGCSIPNSIRSTSEGITFANESGVYLIDRNFQISYVGAALEGIWQGGLATDNLGEVSSFNNTKERQFYISAPTAGGEHLTLVYDYSLRDPLAKTEVNGWTIYDGFIPSVWASSNSNFYYGSFLGTVMEDRDSGDVTDYRDDESGITAVLELAPTSFGDTGTRAQLDKVITHLDYETSVTGCDVSVAVDSSTEFDHAGTINVEYDGRRTRSIFVTPPKPHALYFQARWEHTTIDETIRITGIDYKASQLSDEGLEEADS